MANTPPRIFALVDCNNFYASCERVFQPHLKNKPIVVLSNNDGCVIARSNEAKAIGIKMGEPAHHVKHLFQQHNVKVFSANFALYGDMSRRVMEVLEKFTPDVEIYSVDEAFLDLTGFRSIDLTTYSRTMRYTVKLWTGIPVSIGIAPTKTLCKVAGDLAKASSKANGVLELLNPYHQQIALERTPVSDVWGVGRQQATKLGRKGIKNALQLRDMDDKDVMKVFNTVVMMRTVWELRGKPCIPLEQVPPLKKSIMCSRSFGYLVTELNELKQAVATYAARAAEKMRGQGLATKHVMVFLRTNTFREWEPQYSKSITIRLPVATDSTHELIGYILPALEHIYDSQYRYHKAGVMMMDLIPASQVQQNLFDRADRNKLSKLMRVLDLVNLDLGQGTLRYASEGLEKRWKMKQGHKSKRFTTCLDELMEV